MDTFPHDGGYTCSTELTPPALCARSALSWASHYPCPCDRPRDRAGTPLGSLGVSLARTGRLPYVAATRRLREARACSVPNLATLVARRLLLDAAFTLSVATIFAKCALRTGIRVCAFDSVAGCIIAIDIPYTPPDIEVRFQLLQSILSWLALCFALLASFRLVEALFLEETLLRNGEWESNSTIAAHDFLIHGKTSPNPT